MVDPVFNRPMFQGSPMVQGPSMPTASAVGTGITSMVTPPDVGSQQLKSFANAVTPTVQAYAGGGPVQHFDGGGIANMWDNFVNSLTIKEPNRSGNYRLPDVGLRIGQHNEFRKDAGITAGNSPNYVEPIDVGGPEAIISEDQRDKIRLANSLGRLGEEQARDPRSAENLRNDEAVRQRQIETREAGIPSADRIREAVGSGASNAMLPRVLNRNPGPDLLDQQQMEMAREANRRPGFRDIGQEPAPPMPGPGFEVDTSKPAQPKGEISTHLADIKAQREAQSSADRRENALMALMSAGFGMAAGKSPHALTNIGEGGQQGIATFAQLEKGRREDENRRYLSELHQKEVDLRERELKAREPLLKAQSEYYTARPGIEADKIAARERAIVSKATMDAEAKIAAMEKGNPLAFYTNGKPDPMAKEIARNKLLEQYKKQYNDYYKSGIASTGNGLGLDLSAPE